MHGSVFPFFASPPLLRYRPDWTIFERKEKFPNLCIWAGGGRGGISRGAQANILGSSILVCPGNASKHSKENRFLLSAAFLPFEKEKKEEKNAKDGFPRWGGNGKEEEN